MSVHTENLEIIALGDQVACFILEAYCHILVRGNGLRMIYIILVEALALLE